MYATGVGVTGVGRAGVLIVAERRPFLDPGADTGVVVAVLFLADVARGALDVEPALDRVLASLVLADLVDRAARVGLALRPIRKGLACVETVLTLPALAVQQAMVDRLAQPTLAGGAFIEERALGVRLAGDDQLTHTEPAQAEFVLRAIGL